MGDRCLSHIVWNFRMTAMIFMYVDVMFLFCSHCVCVYRAAGLWLAVYRVACMEIVSIKAGSGPSIC